ncbi:hypothetical protein CC86DRAFT_116400 [Ophiobolus disseminans]|uniref:Uncharacterized protein n=1 Tax=Ophiobolus disseminans TaxID=1469910 RepID=A0A6A6ZK05_9PLEO|nr:hypothetical protein CC86DRAFT_116400 [Ophiobolus disseminans]
MTSLSVPGATKVTTRPLSNHGMPKPRRAMSPEFPHRFTGLTSASPPTVSGFASPQSSGSMSPPMSARSFGTFIDSEPSTPAYSPRLDYDWDDPTLVLLRPLSSSSEPSSPTEPVWEMVQPMKRPKQASRSFMSHKRQPSAVARETFSSTKLAPAPKGMKSTRRTRPVKDTQAVQKSETEVHHSHDENNDKGGVRVTESVGSNAVPFGKLASKMKLMLRRKSASSGKKKEEKEKDYYGPEEALHWTEM